MTGFNHKRLMTILTALLMTAMILSLCACGSSSSGDDGEETETLGEVANVFAGVIQTTASVKIELKDGFTVSSINVEAGDSVKIGDVLFEYDTSAAALTLENTKLEKQQIELNITKLNENIAALQQEKAAASQSQQLSYSLEIQSAQADLMEAQYNLQTKTKEVEKQEAAIADNKVKATIDGVVESVNTDGKTDSSGNKLPFMVLTGTDSMQALGYVNENNISDLEEGMKVVIKSRVDDQEWSGVITKIDKQSPTSGSGSDSSASTSSKYPFYVAIDDFDGLMLGQHVYIEVKSADQSGEDTADETTADETTDTSFAE